MGFETNFNRSYSKSRVHLQHKHTIIIVYSTFRSFSLVFPGYWAIHSLDNESFCLPVRNGGWERSLSFDTTVQPGSNIHSARRSSWNPKKSRVAFPVQTSKFQDFPSLHSLMPSREASFCERSTCQNDSWVKHPVFQRTSSSTSAACAAWIACSNISSSAWCRSLAQKMRKSQKFCHDWCRMLSTSNHPPSCWVYLHLKWIKMGHAHPRSLNMKTLFALVPLFHSRVFFSDSNVQPVSKYRPFQLWPIKSIKINGISRQSPMFPCKDKGTSPSRPPQLSRFDATITDNPQDSLPVWSVVALSMAW